MRICELRDKEVINTKDCKILGFVADVVFDICTGCVIALIIPGPAKICGFLGREIEYIIPYKCVQCIGPDVILVEVCVEEITNKCV